MLEFLPKNKEPLENKDAQEIQSIEVFEQQSGKVLKDIDSTIDEIQTLEKKINLRENLDTETPVRESLTKTKGALKKITKFVFLRVLPAYIAYWGAAELNEKPIGKYSEKDRAQKEMQEKGITSEQQSVYKLGVSEMLYRGIQPFGYQNDLDTSTFFGKTFYKFSGTTNNLGAVQNFGSNVIEGREEDFIKKDKQNGEASKLSLGREDAWRLMLGLPQQYKTFGISDYKPEKSQEDKYYFKLNNYSFESIKEDIFKNNRSVYPDENSVKKAVEKLFGDTNKTFDSDSSLKNYVSSLGFEDGSYNSLQTFYILKYNKKPPINFAELGTMLDKIGEHSFHFYDSENFIMGNYTVSFGKDSKGTYFSYYDKWDLDNTAFKASQYLARGYELYDRIYYNSDTGEVINN